MKTSKKIIAVFLVLCFASFGFAFAVCLCEVGDNACSDHLEFSESAGHCADIPMEAPEPAGDSCCAEPDTEPIDFSTTVHYTNDGSCCCASLSTISDTDNVDQPLVRTETYHSAKTIFAVSSASYQHEDFQQHITHSSVFHNTQASQPPYFLLNAAFLI